MKIPNFEKLEIGETCVHNKLQLFPIVLVKLI